MAVTKINPEPIAKEFGVSEEMVNDIYKFVFKFIHDRAAEVDWIENYDNTANIKSSFVIPELGKLYLSKERMTKRLKEWKKI